MTELTPATNLGSASSARMAVRGRGEEIVIGLVNNMPGTAFHMAERQFGDLLAHAAQGVPFRLKTFSLIEPPRPPKANGSGIWTYAPVDELWTSRLDGMIVTGAEPKASSLPEEPFWPFLSRLVDWAEDNTISTVWSCLAAHAAVYHLDGIARRGRTDKLFGLFECTNCTHDLLFDGIPPRWTVPHSRFNTLPEAELEARGYRVLSRSQAAGADIFVKQGRALHVFMQGHPEYDAEALLREYRRDVRRYLAAVSERYPEPPAGCFSAETRDAFAGFRRKAMENRRPELLAELPPAALMWGGHAQWRPVAQRFYRNWFAHLAAHARAQIEAPALGRAPADFGRIGSNRPEGG